MTFGDARGLLRVGVRAEGRERIVSLEGELDLATVDCLNDALVLATGDHPAVLLVDLRGLTFIGSTGLRSLLETQECCRAMGCRLVLVRGGRPAQRLFQIAGLEDRFEFVNDPKETASG
jgi:anti-anti-sigma factor